MKIIISGPKASGKSTIGRRLADLIGIPFVETDAHLEELFQRETGVRRTCREICAADGECAFRGWESRAVNDLAGRDWCVIATGGGTMMNPSSRGILLEGSIVVLLKAPLHLLWERIQRDGLPPFLSCNDGYREYQERTERLYEIMESRSDIVLSLNADNEDQAHVLLLEEISAVMLRRMHSPSTFGEIIRVSTFGESHGPAVGAVIDGLPPRLPLTAEEIQNELDRRRPGQSAITTPRDEEDRVHILSGVLEGKTTGAPVCLMIYNRDQDPSKYEAFKTLFRPGHADFAFWKKYGIRDHRGGGRSSGRETAARVAAGAVAKQLLKNDGIEIIAYAEEIAGIRGTQVVYGEIEKNAVRSADPLVAPAMEEAIMAARKEKDSVGGIVRLVIRNVPPGLGDPVFYKLDARLGMAFFSIGAVKGVEFGAGFAAAGMSGSRNNDPMEDGKFLTNNAGGILGGISTGEDIVARIAVKPTPSVASEQKTMGVDGRNAVVTVEGRHDPCIVPRIVPVVESMAALVVLDALEIQKRIER